MQVCLTCLLLTTPHGQVSVPCTNLVAQFVDVLHESSGKQTGSMELSLVTH